MEKEREGIIKWHRNEVHELKALNSSMCTYADCVITFNTSSLMLSGAVQGQGKSRTNICMVVLSYHNVDVDVNADYFGDYSISILDTSLC